MVVVDSMRTANNGRLTSIFSINLCPKNHILIVLAMHFVEMNADVYFYPTSSSRRSDMKLRWTFSSDVHFWKSGVLQLARTELVFTLHFNELFEMINLVLQVANLI